jgi:hypothetical protein
VIFACENPGVSRSVLTSVRTFLTMVGMNAIRSGGGFSHAKISRPAARPALARKLDPEDDLSW